MKNPIWPADSAQLPSSGELEKSAGAAQIALGIARREAWAETALVQRYGAGVMYILRREAADAFAVDDLYQECFRIAIERLRKGGLQEPHKLAAFVVGIARHLLMAHYRASRRQQWEKLSAEEAPAATASPYDQLCRLQAMELVEGAIARLTVRRDRDLLRRRYLLDEDKQSICQALGLSSQQYNRSLHRARGRLRKALGDSRAMLYE